MAWFKESRIFEYIRKNIWTLVTVAITAVMFVMIGRNLVHAISIGFEIGRLENQREKYQSLVTRDSTLLQSLSCDDVLEKYAREKFYMQSQTEEIYVFE